MQQQFSSSFNSHSCRQSGIDLAVEESKKIEQSIKGSLSGEAPILNSLIGVDVSGKISLAGSKSEAVQFALAQSTASRSRLFQLATETQVGTFALKFTKIPLAGGFIDRINLLPSEYNYAAYKQFVLDYGTHYFAQGE